MQTQEASQAAGPKPPPKECETEGCTNLVWPYLRPGFAGRPAQWLVGNKCEACSEAEAREYLKPPAEPGASLARWGNLPAAARGWTLDAARARAEAAKTDPEDRERWLASFVDVAAWDGAGRWLLLYGPPGLGKTSLGYALLNRHMGRDRGRVYFLPYLEIGPTLGGEAGAQMLQRAKDAGLLLLDSLGTTRATQRVWGALAGVLDARRRERRPTVVTLDFTPAELPARLRDKNQALTQRLTAKSLMVAFGGRPFVGPAGA